MLVKHGSLDLDGASIGYTVYGDGPPIVFIHGFTLDRRMWTPQIEEFARDHRVLTYDLRGFGLSSDPDESEPYWHVDDLAALLDHLQIGPARIAGLSYGGRVAIEFALEHPERTSSLILVDSTIRNFPYGPRWQGVLEELGVLARADRLEDAKNLWLGDVVFDCPRRSHENSALLQEMVADYRGWHLIHTDSQPELDPPPMDRLGELTMPILAITGSLDIQEFHDVADFVFVHAPDVQRVVMQESGHMANMDDPETFNRVVLEFIAVIPHNSREAHESTDQNQGLATLDRYQIGEGAWKVRNARRFK